MIPSDLAAQAQARGLALLGACHEDGRTILLLGPDPSRFWSHLTASPEWGGPDPVDAWSSRVIGAWARDLSAEARFPFGLPHQPFLRWATASGRCHPSPVGMLVHDTQGLMVSFRGALLFDGLHPIDPAPPSPCDGCHRPCERACPVAALTPAGYDLPACHAHLDTPANTCMPQGCAVRRACPASPPRPHAQSAHHMAHFHEVER